MSKREFNDDLPQWAHLLREFGSFGIVAILLVFYVLKLEPALSRQTEANLILASKLERIDKTLDKFEMRMLEPKAK
jgi:hypothetical protein